MADTTHFYDTIVIGGGQAGLATGYHLSQHDLSFTILDASKRIGDGWRTRWDSLRLFTPARLSGLPGMTFPAPGHSFPTKDEMADYLEAYAARFNLPVQSGVRVDWLGREGDLYQIRTPEAQYTARNVIVAMSTFQIPRIPSFADQIDPGIVQMHSKAYQNPSQLQEGSVLVVGAGNSGTEIALDVHTQHETILSGNYPGQLPFAIDSAFARYLFLPVILPFLGGHVLTTNTPVGRRAKPRLSNQGAPLVRTRSEDIEAAGIKHVTRVGGVQNGLPVLEDQRVMNVANVIWCTGFRPSFDWIDLPIFGGKENPLEPIHERGVVKNEPGLYFVGLFFLFSAASSVLAGVGRDAKYVVDYLMAQQARVRSM